MIAGESEALVPTLDFVAKRSGIRTLILRATLARRDRELRLRLIERTKEALQRARRDAEPPELWTPAAELVERVETSTGES